MICNNAQKGKQNVFTEKFNREGNGQDSIQSSTIPDPGHHMGK